jgi:RimJ/RimL family protein N-acetyltransferase
VSADWSVVPTLRGRRVLLVPLTEEHAAGLLAAADDDDVFTHLSTPRPRDVAESLAQVRGALAQPARQPFAQLDPATGAVLGTTSFYDVDPATSSLAIGATWLSRRVQRTGVNREAKLLLLDHAFGERGAVRVVWHTDERNERSRTAIAALGAVEEGHLRKHRRRRDGSWRTTVQFALTDDDWPAVRARLVASLARGSAG